MLKVIVAGVVVLVAAAGIYVISSQDKSETPDPIPAASSTDAGASNPQSPGQAEYIDYSDGVIAATEGQKILFFHAPWCPQCRALETDIKKGPVPGGVTIIKVDYDSMQELRQKYGVTLQTTLVKVDDSGNLVKKYVAYDEPTLANLVDNLL